jgi:ABC-type branched-subunit amino acid transport system substrate-binding protein
LRELAAYHEKRAAGAVASVPKGAAPFHAGTGAPEPSDDELSALAARASTPADHHALEEYFQTAAKRYREAVNEHSSMAQAYRGTRIAQAAVHCDRLVSLSRDEAKEATAAAEMHKQLAAAGR